MDCELGPGHEVVTAYGNTVLNVSLITAVGLINEEGHSGVGQSSEGRIVFRVPKLFGKRGRMSENSIPLPSFLPGSPPLGHTPLQKQRESLLYEKRTRVILEARRRGAILRPLGDVIVIMPPLTTTAAEVGRLTRITVESIRGVLN